MYYTLNQLHLLTLFLIYSKLKFKKKVPVKSYLLVASLYFYKSFEPETNYIFPIST